MGVRQAWPALAGSFADRLLPTRASGFAERAFRARQGTRRSRGDAQHRVNAGLSEPRCAAEVKGGASAFARRCGSRRLAMSVLLGVVQTSDVVEVGADFRFRRAGVCWLDRVRLTARLTPPAARAGEAAV